MWDLEHTIQLKTLRFTLSSIQREKLQHACTWHAAGVNKTQPSQTHTDLDRFCQHSQLCLCFNKQTGQTPAGLCLRDTRGAARGREAVNKGRAASCESPNTLTRDTTLSSGMTLIDSACRHIWGPSTNAAGVQ